MVSNDFSSCYFQVCACVCCLMVSGLTIGTHESTKEEDGIFRFLLLITRLNIYEYVRNSRPAVRPSTMMDPMPSPELIRQIFDNTTNKVDAVPKILRVSQSIMQ